MPALKNYRIYISHGWDWKEEYYRLADLLDKAPFFRWTNCSIPEYDPLRNSKNEKKIKQELDSHIKPVNLVIVLSGMYNAHSSWMQKEIDTAIKHNRPIIGVVPLGGHRIPAPVQEAVLETVDWNARSIVDAIRRNAR